MATNTSSKYDNITNKVLISEGSPSVYQLKPKKENIGGVKGITLKRKTLGEKDPTKINKTILLVGETGTGKSTLINALVNYAMGVEWEDDVWFQIVDEKEKESQSESQTSEVIVYEIFGFEGKTLPFSLTIIDTPEYGDTRGTEVDDTVSQRLFHLFRSSDGVHEINAVGLVMKVTENRLSDRLRYILDSVVSLFGNDMEKNIVALLTHSDGLTPENVLQALKAANIKCAKDEEGEPLHFMFNNRQRKQSQKTNKAALKAAWDLTKDQMDQFTDFLKQTSPQNLKTTLEVLDKRTRLAACIQNLLERIALTELKQTEIQQIKEALKQHEQEMKSNENFMVEVDEPCKVKVRVNERRWWMLGLNYGGAVTCNVCKENCHYPCTLAWYPKHCEVIKHGRCTVCTGKCPASDHVKEKKKYETKTRKVKKTLEDVNEKYEKNKAGSESKLSFLETLEKEMEELQREKDQWLAESFQHVIKLEEISLNVDSLSTHVHLDFLIEKMKEKGDTEKVQKLEEMKARMKKDKGAKEALRNTSSKYDTNKVLISEGSPSVYRLIPKKENIGDVKGITLKRKTLGVKDPNKINKTILLVGETGTGKSTLTNALVNYAMGVEWEDDVWFQIVDEKEKESQTESQTSEVIVYEIFGFEGKTLPFSLTIIDTPGYGDTSGTEVDVTVSQRLFHLFRSRDGVHEINAVGLVMKASENRLTDRLRYIFNSVVSLFGNDMEKNIVALVTHSDGLTPENVLQALKDANIKCAKDEEDEPLHFLFNNRQRKQRAKKNQVALKAAWDLTKDQMDQFTDFLKQTSPQNLKTTAQVLDKRTRLAACIQNLQDKIELTELKQTEIQQTQKALKQHEQEMKSNEKFKVEVDEPYKVKVDVSETRWWGLWLNYGGAVTCNVCKENCHNPCTLAWYAEHCEVIKRGRCTVCTGKCPVSDHVKEKKKYVTKTRKVKKTLGDVKEKYEKNKAGSESKLSFLETLEKEMEELQRGKDRLLVESFQHVIKLEEISLNVNSLSTHVHLDFLIEKMKEKGDTEKVQKLEEMKAQMEKDEGAKSAMRYAYGNTVK